MKYIIIILLVLFAGCASSNNEPRMYDLLYRDNAKNIAYKSVSPEDYITKEYN